MNFDRCWRLSEFGLDEAGRVCEVEGKRSAKRRSRAIFAHAKRPRLKGEGGDPVHAPFMMACDRVFSACSK
jgi:hypothetical protein